MRIALVLILLTLTGCSTIAGKNRILLCIGFCALQGVEVTREDGTKLVLPVIPPSKPTEAPKP